MALGTALLEYWQLAVAAQLSSQRVPLEGFARERFVFTQVLALIGFHLKVRCPIDTTSAAAATAITTQKYSVLATNVDCCCSVWPSIAVEVWAVWLAPISGVNALVNSWIIARRTARACREPSRPAVAFLKMSSAWLISSRHTAPLVASWLRRRTSSRALQY